MDSSVHNSSNASVASSALFLRRARMSFVRHHFCDNHACIMVKVRTKKAWNGTGELFLASWHSVSSPRTIYVLTCRTTLARVCGPYLTFFIHIALQTSGGICIQLINNLPGIDLSGLQGMALLLLGSIQCLIVIFCLFLSPIRPLSVFNSPGPGIWKLNTSVLQNDDYLNLISSFWHW